MENDRDFWPRYFFYAIFLLAFSILAYWAALQIPHVREFARVTVKEIR